MEPTTETTTMTRKKTDDEAGLTKQIAVRLSESDHERLLALSTRIPMSAIARDALLVGLEAIERQPGILIGEKPKR